jgi:hypothetical protein
MTELLTYAKFHTNNEVEVVTALLDKADIAYQVEREKNLLDKIYVGESYDPMIALKIANTDFITVNELMVNSVEIDINTINKDYYLLHFSIAELLSVLKHPYDWNYFDQALAKYLLPEQQVVLSSATYPSSVSELHYEPISLGIQWLILEYLLSILLVYAGIIIGGFTLIANKTLPNGKKVAIYNDYIRNNGKWLIGIGIVRFIYHYFL